MVKNRNKPLRYIEISHRNRSTRIFVGQGNMCHRVNVCGDVCIDIKRAGKEICGPKVVYDSCCNPTPVPMCEAQVAHVCALEIDEEGYAVFEWGDELLKLKEGWYEGHVKTGCDTCGIVPLRVGPRCNVLEVETEISGPDNACYVGCEDPCEKPICPVSGGIMGQSTTVHVPDYNYKG
jgi:hypothetical protein